MPTADSKGALRRSKVSDGEKSDIIIELRKGRSVQEVARLFGRDESTITRIVKELKPTKALAQAKLEASLATLVDKVIDKADVNQIVDILSRPNIGVLEAPVKAGGGAGGPNIGISVQVGSLAAVNPNEYAKPQVETVDTQGTLEDGKNIRLGPLQVGQSSVVDV